MLRLVGREADIAGINANLAAGDIGGHSVADVGWERMAEKVDWVREGAVAAGRAFEDIELSMAQWLLHVTEDRNESDAPDRQDGGPVGRRAGMARRCAGRAGRLALPLRGEAARLAGSSRHQLRAGALGATGADLSGIGQVVAELAGT